MLLLETNGKKEFIKMTNNKTELQEFIENQRQEFKRQGNHMGQHMCEAAQSYAELPSKIEGLQTYKLSGTSPEILVERDEILKLLEGK